MVPIRAIIWQSILVTALSGLLGGSGWMLATVGHGQAKGVVRPWQIVTSPNTTTGSNQLLGVAALTPHDIWAVGHSSAPTQALIEHYDGTRWSIVSSPIVADATGTFLNAVAGVSPRDVWAVGGFSIPSAPPAGSTTQTLIEHFDGTHWQVVASPNPLAAPGLSFLSGVVALSPRNIWTVGSFLEYGRFNFRTLVEHYDGTRWSIVSSPNVGSEENVLNGVSAASPRDIWAVGRSGMATAEYRTLVEHYDGTRWSVVPSPNATPGGNNLDAVAAASPRNVWAVGFQFIEDVEMRTLIEHFDGRTWSVIPSPEAGVGDKRLRGVAIASPNSIWAVGEAVNATAGATQTLIEHFDGRAWSVIPSPNVASEDNRLVGVAALSAQNTWAVGFAFNANLHTSQTLIEHQAP